MISEKEQARIRLLSDNELYEQAVEFTRGIGGTLPGSQINGLLNVALANTYEHLEAFVKHQHTRSTWRASERYIPEFYRKLEHKLKELERLIPSLTERRQTELSPEDRQTLKMLLAREFIQHVLAENGYQGVQRSVHQADRGAPPRQQGAGNPRRPGAPQQRFDNRSSGHQRGPATR